MKKESKPPTQAVVVFSGMNDRQYQAYLKRTGSRKTPEPGWSRLMYVRFYNCRLKDLPVAVRHGADIIFDEQGKVNKNRYGRIDL